MHFSFSTLNYNIDLLYQKIHFYSAIDFFDPDSTSNNIVAPNKLEYSLLLVKVNGFRVGSSNVGKSELAVNHLKLFSCCKCPDMGNNCC